MRTFITKIVNSKEANIIDNNQTPRRPNTQRAKANVNRQPNNTQSPAPQQGKPGGQPAPKRKKNTAKNIFFGVMRFIGICICIGVMAVSVGAVLVSLYVVKETAGDAETLNLDNIKLSYAATIKVKDPSTGNWVDDKRLVQTENREWINLDQIPADLQHAFIAIEDKDFEYHMGFSIKRTTFAVINELFEKVTGSYLSGNMQGASTIHQQLIKNLTNDDEQDYGRKIREIFRAIALNNRYSRDIILEAYLNTIRLTGNIAGVQAGAHNYFDKRLGEDTLSIAECASIAAVTKDPTEYNPFTNPAKHLDRRNDVLYFMRRQMYITQEQYVQALNEPLKLAEVKTAAATGVNTYAQDAVIDDVIDAFVDKYGWTREEATSEFYNGGYTVYATYDPAIQSTMEQVLNNRKMFPEYKQLVEEKDAGGNIKLDPSGNPIMVEISSQAAMVIIDYNGEIKGCVGGLGPKEKDRVLNRAMDMQRAVGSTMKGVTVYPTAIDQELITWSTPFLDDFYEMINDNGVERKWPVNYEKSYKEKDITVEEAVTRSVNTVAVRVGTDVVGVRTLFDFAYDTLQIKSLVPTDNGDIGKAQMCLGALSKGMTPVELAGAYMMYGNKGEYITPHTYVAVENTRGEVVLEPEVVRVQAIGEDTAYIMNRLLSNVLGPGGTAPGIRTKTTDGVGKTGTTNETRDVWFAGVTPNYVTACWFGYDNNDPLGYDQKRPKRKEYYDAGRIKHPGASAWRDIMDIIQENTENKNFAISENVEQKQYCRVSGANPGPLCTEQGTGYYKKGTELGSCTAAGHY